MCKKTQKSLVFGMNRTKSPKFRVNINPLLYLYSVDKINNIGWNGRLYGGSRYKTYS